MMRLTDNRGISFIQVIMASTAIAGLALVGLRLAQGQKKLVDSVYSDRLSHHLFQEVTFLLKKESICTSTFSGLNPSNGKVGKLLEIITTSSGRIENEFFPITSKANSGEGKYFDGLVSLLNYELTDAYEGSNIAKGLTALKVEQLVIDEIVEKLIPMKFTIDQEGKIDKCQLFESGGNSATGKWQQSSTGLKLMGSSLTIGDNSGSRQKIVSSGELKINPLATLPSCTEEFEGLLIHKRGGGLKVCQKGAWIPFGEQRLRYENATSYILHRTSVGSEAKFTKKHRICFINKLKKNSISDGCQIRRVSSGFESEYELKIFTSSDVTNSECEVSCVD
jgi:hypothetical protein